MKNLVLAILLAIPTVAAAGPGTDAVKSANDTISDLLKKQAEPAKVTTSVNNFIDIDELGKRSMGSHWEGLKKEQQTKFLTKLHQLIEANYTKGMKANLDYKVAYTGESTDAKGNLVVTTKITAQKKGRPVEIEVDYILTKQGNGYRAFDVVTDSVGLVDNYGQQFDKLISKDGFDGLLTKMDKKIAELNGTAAANGTSGGGAAGSK